MLRKSIIAILQVHLYFFSSLCDKPSPTSGSFHFPSFLLFLFSSHVRLLLILHIQLKEPSLIPLLLIPIKDVSLNSLALPPDFPLQSPS